MPYSEHLADLMRAHLDLLPGHMVCGTHKGGTMSRPGKPREVQPPTNPARLPPKKKA